MKILFDISNFIGNVICLMIGAELLRIFIDKLPDFKKVLLTGSILSVATFFVVTGIKNIIVSYIALFICFLVLSFLFSCPVIKKLWISIFAVLLLLLSELLFRGFLCIMAGQSLEQNVFSYMLIRLISRVCIFVLIRYLSASDRRGEQPYFRHWRTLFFIFPLPIVLAVYACATSMQVNEEAFHQDAAVLLLFLSVANCIYFYFCEFQAKLYEKTTEGLLLKQQMDRQTEYHKKQQEWQEKANRRNHDLKTQLIAVNETMHRDREKGTELLDQIYQDLVGCTPLVFSKNEAIDALLTVKLEKMKCHNIENQVRVFMSDTGNIEILDLCTVLGNLLDNAIEACLKDSNPDRLITFRLFRKEEYISITITNSIAAPVVIKDGDMIETTKQDSGLHGYGLNTVRSIVDKYDGMLSFDQGEKLFRVIVMMRCEPKENS